MLDGCEQDICQVHINTDCTLLCVIVRSTKRALKSKHTDDLTLHLTYILLTKREGRTGRISALGLDSMDRAQQGLYRKDHGLIFSQYGPEQAWLIRYFITQLCA